MTLEPGATLGPYEIVAQIGAGGMGVVWKAFDPSLNRHVAIKILPADLTSDPEWRLRFQREAQAAARLDHPNIAVIHQVGEEDGNPYIVMQLLDGRTLRQILREGPLPLRDWLRVSSAMADGLAHAHRHGVVHRDLKPDNVMVTSDQQVKILDFGLAKVFESGSLGERTGAPVSGPELTRAGQVFGTRSYMSPEQARCEATDHRSDIFSLGILLYEMACGRVPFKGGSDVEILSAIISEQPASLADSGQQVPGEAERVVRKAMEKEPDRRYQHADEMATDLRNLQRDLTSGFVTSPTGSLPDPPRTPPSTGTGADKTRIAVAIAILIVLAIAIVGYVRLRPAPDSAGAAESVTVASSNDRKMIVVLPFENLGPVEEAYFAAGMTEEITSRLAVVSGLGVISRNSAARYADTTKTIKQIGEELGVGYVLEGTVRWAGQSEGKNRVRITQQLIRVADDTYVWSETYDAVIDDIFQVQSEIATKVISHVGLALGSARDAIDFQPTENLEAYGAYVRGLHHFRLPDYTEESYQLQVEMFERAVELDPEFAQAHAMLSRSHAAMYHFGYDRTPDRQTIARRAADRALELAPDAHETHLALGVYHYWCHKDYERALQSLSVARAVVPWNTDILEIVGFVRRRQGRWGESAASLERALELNPVASELNVELGATYTYMRQYERAERHYNRSMALLPDEGFAFADKALLYWLWKGTTPEARASLESTPSEDPALTWFWFRQGIYEGRFEETIQRLEASPVDVVRYFRVLRPTALLLGQTYDLLDQPERARRAYDAARVILEQEAQARPDDYRVHSALGIALTGLGRDDEGLLEASKAAEMYPISRDAVFGSQTVEDLALIYTMMGRHDKALDQIELLLSVPTMFSVPLVRLDPRYEALERLPRFQELAQRYE